jgi:hypothetical protein
MRCRRGAPMPKSGCTKAIFMRLQIQSEVSRLQFSARLSSLQQRLLLLQEGRSARAGGGGGGGGGDVAHRGDNTIASKREPAPANAAGRFARQLRHDGESSPSLTLRCLTVS